MDINKKRAYARQLLAAINLQKGGHLTLSAGVEAAEIVHLVVEEAYKMGAYDVDVNWSDSELNKLRVNLAPEEALMENLEWQDMRTMYGIEKKTCYLSVGSPNPDGNKGIDKERMKKMGKKEPSEAAKRRKAATGTNELRWCGSAIPNPTWAKLVFPDLSEEEAVERLWEDIITTCYADGDDPETAWKNHIADVLHRRRRLDELKLAKLHFTTGLGTDITAELSDVSIFDGGMEFDPDGIGFTPNVPTEEVFTTPHRLKVNGVVKSSLPLMRGGRIENFTIRFEEGRAVEYHAEVGEDLLKDIIETDEGSHYIGEVALVSKSSAVNRCGHLFYCTLFDENAVCHMALGNGYRSAYNTDENDKEKLTEMGFNFSKTHCDFMFGTDDLKCVGTTRDGEEIVIMENGEFVI